MKQSKVKDYRPNYPKKLIRGAILTTAAAVALAGTTGCDMLRTGGAPEPVPTDELVLDGETTIDPGLDDNLMEPDEPMVDENGIGNTDEEDESDGREGPELMGKIVVPEDTPEP